MKRPIYTDHLNSGWLRGRRVPRTIPPLARAFKRGELTLVLSEVTVRELETAPEEVRMLLGRVPAAHIEALGLFREAEELAADYIQDGAIGARMRADARHIALATTARVDVLVSWNSRHIVNLKRIHADKAVNLKHGYPLPTSRDSNTPGGPRR